MSIEKEFNLSPGADFVDVARGILTGARGGAGAYDGLPVDWLNRHYDELAASPYLDAFTNAVAELATDADPEVRTQVLTFFAWHPTASGAERLVELARGDRALFMGKSPFGSEDLTDKLLGVVATIGAAGNRDALALAQSEALGPRADAVVATLTRKVPDWVVAHAEAIVKACRPCAAIILFNLPPPFSAAAVAERLAPFAGDDPEFRDAVRRFVPAPDRDRILAAHHP